MRLPFAIDFTKVGATAVIIIVAFVVAELGATIMQEVAKDLLHHRYY